MKRFMIIILLLTLAMGSLWAQRSKRKQRGRSSKALSIKPVEYYSSDYIISLGSKYFWNGDLNGVISTSKGEYIRMFNNNSFGLGAFGEFTMVNSSGFKNGIFTETGLKYLLGLKMRYKWTTSFVDFYSGFGHLEYTGEINPGFISKDWGTVGMIGVAYRTYGDRQYGTASGSNNPIWFNDTRLFAEYHMPIAMKGDFLLPKPLSVGIDLELFPSYFKFGSEIAIVDWTMSQKFLLPVGFESSLMIYDFNKFKVIAQFSLFAMPYINQERLAKVYFSIRKDNHNNVNSSLVLGANFYFDFFIKAPSSRGNQSSSKSRPRGRGRTK